MKIKKKKDNLCMKQVKHYSLVNVYHIGGENVSLHLSINYIE